jgi:hypothetical protein
MKPSFVIDGMPKSAHRCAQEPRRAVLPYVELLPMRTKDGSPRWPGMPALS